MSRKTLEDESKNLIIRSEKDGQALLFPQIRAAATVSQGLFLCGAIIGWSGSVLTKMRNDFAMSTTEYSLIASLISYGALFGSLLSGRAMDILGRRNLMLTITPMTGCGWLLVGIAPSIYLVYFGRFICGLSAGFFLNSCNVYTSETCQAALRGRLGSLPALSMTSGVLISYMLGGFFAWRKSAFLSIVPAGILFIGLLTIPESPYWYLLKGNDEAASLSLRRLRGPKYNFENELKEMTRKITDVGINISYIELFKRRTLIPLMVAFFIQTLQQFSGGNVIMTYTSLIFEETRSTIDSQMATIYTGIAQLLGTVASIFFIDRSGRRMLLSFSVTFCGVFIVILGVYFLVMTTANPWPTWSPLVFVIGLVFFYCLGCRSIPWLIGSEIFNTSIRSRANSVTVFYNRVLNIIVIEIYPYTVHGLGDAAVYLFYGTLCFLFAIGTIFVVPETKGRSLEEIQEYFEKKAVKRKQERQ